MAQDQSVVPEGRCGFEMLAGDVSKLSAETLSEAVKQNRNAVCWRETINNRQRCDWHADNVDISSLDSSRYNSIKDEYLIVLDGANVPGPSSPYSLRRVVCRYGSFSEKDISTINLSDSVFSQSNFSSADFEKGRAPHSDFSRSDFTGANLSDSLLMEVKFDEAILRGADISGASITGGEMNNTNLIDVEMGGCDARSANFSSATLVSADLSDSDLVDADISNGELRDADVSNACAIRVDLSDSQLDSANFCDADLFRANFFGSELTYTKLKRANLRRAELSEAWFFGADLSGADLSFSSAVGSIFYEADLSGAEIQYATLTEADFEKSDLSEASLESAILSESVLTQADLSEAELPQADLSDADFSKAYFIEANLSDATAKDASFRNASFGIQGTNCTPANLENAIFRNADLRGADFTDARLDQIDLTDARIDAQTTFDAETIYEREEDVTSDVRDDGDDAVPPSVWVHRRLERLHEENALSSVARQFHIRKQRARRRHRRREGEWLGWAWLTLLGATMGYGEKPRRVLGTAGAVVGLWTLLYPLGNWVVPNPGTPEAAQRGLDDGTSAAAAAVQYPAYPSSLAELPVYYDAVLGTLADSLYFSTVTFTTLGFGDFSPVGLGRVLATIESALGVTLFAVLVFVLGRRATR